MGGVKWGYFLDLNTLHEFVVMMPAILGFIFEMAPMAITLKILFPVGDKSSYPKTQ